MSTERFEQFDEVLIDGAIKAVVIIDDGDERVRCAWRSKPHGEASKAVFSHAQWIARDRITRR